MADSPLSLLISSNPGIYIEYKMNQKLKVLARIGFAAKGTVYGIMGGLILLAAFNIGQNKPGLPQVMDFLDNHPLGRVLLVAMTLGLVSYGVWKIIEGIKDLENNGSDAKTIILRVVFVIIGLAFLGLAALGALRAAGSDFFDTTQAGADEAKQFAFLATNTGLILLGVAGAVTGLIGVFLFVKAYKAKFTDSFDTRSMSDYKRRKLIKGTAKVGMSARAFIFLIMGFFLLRASITADPDEIKTAGEVFTFIEDSPFGIYLLALMGIGLLAYASYMYLLSKYRKFDGS